MLVRVRHWGHDNSPLRTASGPSIQATAMSAIRVVLPPPLAVLSSAEARRVGACSEHTGSAAVGPGTRALPTGSERLSVVSLGSCPVLGR